MEEGLRYTTEVLLETPVRVAKLLGGINAAPSIRRALADAGMTEGDLQEGAELLFAAVRPFPGPTPDTDTPEAKRHRAAARELDRWDEPHFARYGAALERRHPSAYRFVFDDLHPARGAAAVNGVAIFLSRIDALEHGTEPLREAHREDDRRAVALLESRGLTRDERRRLADLVHTALAATPPLATRASPAAHDEWLRKLDTLRRWFDEWSRTARTVLKNRNDLIRLGLGHRAKRAV